MLTWCFFLKSKKKRKEATTISSTHATMTDTNTNTAEVQKPKLTPAEMQKILLEKIAKLEQELLKQQNSRRANHPRTKPPHKRRSPSPVSGSPSPPPSPPPSPRRSPRRSPRKHARKKKNRSPKNPGRLMWCFMWLGIFVIFCCCSLLLLLGTPAQGTPTRLSKQKKKRTPKPPGEQQVRKTLGEAIKLNLDAKILRGEYRCV